MASKQISGRFLLMVGDITIPEVEYFRFFKTAEDTENFISLTKAEFEDPIYAYYKNLGQNEIEVNGFSRNIKPSLEWVGMAVLNHHILSSPRRFIFEAVQHHLPLPAIILNAKEVDTPKDLEMLYFID